jgi:molybdenum cofactor synthesis domain-containing protein
MRPTDVKEGKIEVVADRDGLFLVDTERLYDINSLGEMMIATRHGGFAVKKGDKLAGTRVIPLVIEASKMERARAVGGGRPLFELRPFVGKSAGIVATGNEVYHGRIKDTFTPVVEEKLAEYGSRAREKMLLPDAPEGITAAILSMIQNGADMVLCTGGMSVDPDDRTPLAIKNTGADIVSYGAPVLPGAMFMLAYYDGKVPIVGLPGCVMYSKRTIFDLVLPRLMANVPVTGEWLASLGHGGLCLNCAACTYPNCGFGKS